MKSFFTIYQPINLLTTKSARNQGTSSLFQRLRQMKQEIKQQLLPRDFEQFARRMRLIFFKRKNREPHPFHVKATWMPQVQDYFSVFELENGKAYTDL